ncbi:MAG: hypothetical protein LH628_23615 [Microcoleus sp. CAN_BIN18]|nr:hypothetical protein [Microcoleus sp. CAN_BIN18]
MFTVVDIGYFDRQSGSNWICWVCWRRCKLVIFAVKGLDVGGLWGWDVLSRSLCRACFGILGSAIANLTMSSNWFKI